MTNDKTNTDAETEAKLDPYKRIEIARKTLEFLCANDIKKKCDLVAVLNIVAGAANVKINNDSYLILSPCE